MTGVQFPEPHIDDPGAYQHRFADVNGIRVHYVEEGTGPLVILLHGFPFLWFLWRNQIGPLAAAGHRVVAPDLRGFGQTDGPPAKDMTEMVGDVVGLMRSLGESSAILVGQDAGTLIGHHCMLMRPDLFRGFFMMCSPPAPRAPVKPSVAMESMKSAYPDLVFYSEYLQRPGTAEALDLRDFLSGVFYSTSGACTDGERWRWAWTTDEAFTDTYTVPESLPTHLSQEAVDYYVAEYTRTGLRPPAGMYSVTGDRNWEVTSFLEGAVVRQPSVFLYGSRDPSLMPNFEIDRQGAALAALPAIYSNLEIVELPGVGHTPPEEAPETINELLLKFLKENENE